MSYQAGDISLIELLNNQIAALYMSEHCSDITLYIEGQRIPAHRSIIGARCEYLNTFFSNGLNESNQTKFELDVPLEAFQVLLKYFYTGQMSLSKIKNVETLIEILNLIEEYCLFYLKTHFENYFKQIITVENTCQLLEIAKTYELKELKIKSMNLLDTNADKILASKSFQNIHKDLLEEILTRATFNASSELFLFRAIAEWSKNSNQNIETVIHLVKLPLIPLEELLQIRKLGTLTGDMIFDAIEIQMTAKSTPRSDIQMFEKLPEENVASSKYNVRTVKGNVQNCGSIKYQHKIGDGSSILIKLGQIFIINHLKMELRRSYSYFIEISTDQKKWERIIDYSSFKCWSMQNLYFPSKTAKYVKIVGTFPFNEYFDVSKFEAYYKENIPEIRNGIVVPNKNVYSGIYRIINHSVEINLIQPYYIGSIRFFMRNQDRNHNFCIETSSNQQDWEEVAGRKDEFVNDSQTVRFTSKAIVYIRITIIGKTIGNNYESLRNIISKNFECPSSI